MTDYADMSGQVMTDDGMEDYFQDFLDDLYGIVDIAGHSFGTGKVLREVDYTAFREDFNNWLDSQCKNGEFLDLSLSENTTCETCNGDLTQDEAVTSFTDETGPICTSCLEDEDEDGPVCEECGEDMDQDEVAVALADHGRLFCVSCEEDYDDACNVCGVTLTEDDDGPVCEDCTEE